MAIGDFEIQKKNLQEKIVAAEEEANISMDMTEVESLNKQMADLEAKKHTYEDVVENAEQGASENQTKQIKDLGGDPKVLEEKLEENKEEVKKVEEAVETKEEPKEFTRESIMSSFGNNMLTQNIEESGISSKKYEDEPGKVFVTVSINPENVKEVERFLGNNTKDFKWQWKGGNQLVLEIAENNSNGEVGVPAEQVEVFDAKKMIKDMTGGADKLERYARGYDTALNMYTAALQGGNAEELKKYEEIFSQVDEFDKVTIQRNVTQNSIHDAIFKWDDTYDKAAFHNKFKVLNENSPEMTQLAIGNEMMSLINLDAGQVSKLQEMLGGMSKEDLFRSLQIAKENQFAKFKQKEQEQIKQTTDSLDERIQNIQDPREKIKFENLKKQSIQNIQTERVQKERSTEADYQKRAQLLSN